MTTARSRQHPRLWASALGSLLPAATVALAIMIVNRDGDDALTVLDGLVAAAPFCLGFVALPSLLPLAAARTTAGRRAVLFVMTAVAATASVLAATTDDAQAGLALLWVPLVAVPLALVLWIGHAVAAQHSRPRQTSDTSAPIVAGTSDRLAALAIDVAIIGAVLGGPLTTMSHAGHEVAAGVVGVATATAYLAALVSAHGGTIGQALLRLAVVDAATGARVSLPRSLLRSLVVVLEVAATPTMILAAPALVEVVAAGVGGRSLTDRVFRTKVVQRASRRETLTGVDPAATTGLTGPAQRRPAQWPSARTVRSSPADPDPRPRPPAGRARRHDGP